MPATNPYNPYLPYTSYLPNTPVQQPAMQPQYPTPNLANFGQQTAAAQPIMQPNPIFGRIVASEAEITPKEVPMDGTIALFPLSDYSTIIAKQWTKDGTITTINFVPDTQSIPSETPTMSIDELARSMDSRFNKIEGMLKHRNKPYQKNNASTEVKESSNA